MEQKQSETKSKSSVLKLFVMGCIAMALCVPLMMIYGLVDTRQDAREDALESVRDAYGKNQCIDDIVLICDDDRFKPEQVAYNIDMQSKELRRSIYKMATYDALMDISGYFVLPQSVIDKGVAKVKIPISYAYGVKENVSIKLMDIEYPTQRFYDKLIADIKLPKGLTDGVKVPFSLKFHLRGLDDLSFRVMGTHTKINMTSNFPDPSFYGNCLPDDRVVTSDGFTASWNISPNPYANNSMTVGVELLDTISDYRQIERSLKYALFFIVLVFVAALLTEYLTARTVNLVQYTIVGLSLVLFYALLLSLSEFLGYGAAYFIASAMTISALTLYFKAILRHKAAHILSLLLCVGYVVNYILLQLDTLALLTGTLILFAILCVMMYITSRPTEKELVE